MAILNVLVRSRSLMRCHGLIPRNWLVLDHGSNRSRDLFLIPCHNNSVTNRGCHRVAIMQEHREAEIIRMMLCGNDHSDTLSTRTFCVVLLRAMVYHIGSAWLEFSLSREKSICQRRIITGKDPCTRHLNFADYATSLFV